TAAANDNGKVYRVRMSLAQKQPKEAADDGWLNSLNQRFELRDAAGAPYHLRNINWTNSSTGSATGVLEFDEETGGRKVGPPVRLTYNDWVTFHHELPFEFHDLPLP